MLASPITVKNLTMAYGDRVIQLRDGWVVED